MDDELEAQQSNVYPRDLTDAEARQFELSSQLSVVVEAFFHIGKALLDSVSQAIVLSLGQPPGVRTKHDDFATKLDAIAPRLYLPAPGKVVVERARELEADLADLRDFILVHPKLDDPRYARPGLGLSIGQRGANLHVVQLWPDDGGDDFRFGTTSLDELSTALDTFLVEILEWFIAATDSS